MHERVIIALSAVAGLAGVALSAAAAHLGAGGSLDIAARFLLVHAAVLLAAAGLVGQGLVRPAPGRAAAYLLIVGLALFCGDLSTRALLGERLFAYAAPAGGFALMGGWAMLALAGALGPGR